MGDAAVKSDDLPELAVFASLFKRLVQEAVREEMERAKNDNSAELLTVEQAAQIMKRSTKTVRRYLSVGRLKGTRIAGGSILVERASIDKLVKR